MVSGVADGAANQHRAEDGIDDEPSCPVGGIAVLSRLAEWSIDSLIDSTLQAAQDVHISPQKRRQPCYLDQIPELPVAVFVGQDLIGAIGREEVRAADREDGKSDIGIVGAIDRASAPPEDKRIALAYWNELRETALTQGKSRYGIALYRAWISLKPLGSES